MKILEVNSCISIHAPRVGSDFKFVHFIPPLNNFNPRSPRGERLVLFEQPVKV